MPSIMIVTANSLGIPLLPEKDAVEVLKYGADFTPLLTGDSIVSASVTVTPAGVTLTTAAFVGNVVSTVVSGGVLGASYELAFHVVSTLGFTFKRSGTILVVDR